MVKTLTSEHSMMQKYKIKLPYFEGPLDLLLFFVKRDELNIYDIPISKITRDFLEYIHLMKTLDLEVASEFILMASTLMQIKAKMLLPKQQIEDEEDEDPRAELVRKLIEYKKFKELAGEFSKLEEKTGKIYFRGYFKSDAKNFVDEYQTYEFLRDVTLFDLISAFRKAIENASEKVVHQIEIPPYTIEEEMENILHRLKFRDNFPFTELMRDYSQKLRVIVAFLALLELAKMGRVKIHQSEIFGEIIVERSFELDDKIANAV